VLAPGTGPHWAASDQPLARIHLAAEGNIEEGGAGMLQADFANRFVGGGVLRSGLVQEEIRFTICPELIASLVFTEALQDREALLVIGAEQFSSYTGYGDTFRFGGRVQDDTERDASGRRMTSVVAMDAIRFQPGQGDRGAEVQFRPDKMERELTKAFVAFRDGGGTERLPAVATGNWGCGAFGGDPRLKLVLQLLAASEAGRDVAYFTFGDTWLQEEGWELCRGLQEGGVTVGRLYTILVAFHGSGRRRDGRDLFRWIKEQVEHQDKMTDSSQSETNGADETMPPAADVVCVSDSPVKDLGDLSCKESVEEAGQREQAAGTHAQGMLSVLDRMEKGELSVNNGNGGAINEAPAALPVPSAAASIKKQAKMTDFF
jgi:poly(ADP-ribose) glycohydrolase